MKTRIRRKALAVPEIRMLLKVYIYKDFFDRVKSFSEDFDTWEPYE